MEVLDDLGLKKQPKGIGAKDYVLFMAALMGIFVLTFWLNTAGYVAFTPLMGRIPGLIVLGLVGLIILFFIARIISAKLAIVLNTVAIYIGGFFMAGWLVDSVFEGVTVYEYSYLFLGGLCAASFFLTTIIWHLVYRIWDGVISKRIESDT